RAVDADARGKRRLVLARTGKQQAQPLAEQHRKVAFVHVLQGHQSHAVYYDKHVTRMRRKINTRFALSPCMIRRLLTTSCQDLGGLGPAVSGNTERPHADRTDARQSDEAKRCCGAADRMADSAADRRLLRGLG